MSCNVVDILDETDVSFMSNLNTFWPFSSSRPVEIGGRGGGFSPPKFYLIFFLWIEKNSVKVKNSTKLQNKSKLTGYWYV